MSNKRFSITFLSDQINISRYVQLKIFYCFEEMHVSRTKEIRTFAAELLIKKLRLSQLHICGCCILEKQFQTKMATRPNKQEV